ncbi:MAG: hypothetical protein RL266_462 [Bacteroidota bacterium]|jgi:hypothetical protein
MLKERIDNFIRKYSTIHVAGSKKNLIVISTPRSGSTWLVEILGASKRVKLVREPLNLRKPAVVKDLGVDNWTDLYQDSNKERVIGYLKGFIDGSPRSIDHKRDKPLSSTWHPITDRAVFKVLHGAEAWAEPTQTALNADLIFLIRHPIAVSLSRNFLPRLEAFVDSDFALNFSTEQINEAREIIRSGTFLQKATVDWCFQNAPLLRAKNAGKLIVTYEELTLHTEEMLLLISKKFNLPLSNRMLQQINRPSGSSGKSTAESQALLNRLGQDTEKRQLIEKWQGKVTDEEQIEVFRILAVFDIDIYRYGSFMPSKEYLILNG